MKVVFRTDASSIIGNGHLVRCLTLAKSLKKLKTKCEFICRENKNNLFKEIKKENFKLTLLPSLSNKKHKKNKKNTIKTNWLGLNWKDDANQTINASTRRLHKDQAQFKRKKGKNRLKDKRLERLWLLG